MKEQPIIMSGPVECIILGGGELLDSHTISRWRADGLCNRIAMHKTLMFFRDYRGFDTDKAT